MSGPELCQVADAVQVACIVVCTALMLGRPIRQLGVGCGLGCRIRGCLASLRSLSGTARRIVCGSAGPQDAVRRHEQRMRVDLAGRLCWIGSRAALVLLPLVFLMADDREHAVPRRLHKCYGAVTVVVLHKYPGLMTPRSLHIWYSMLVIGSVLSFSPLFLSAGSVPYIRPLIMFDCMISPFMDMCLPVNLMSTAIAYAVVALTAVADDLNGSACLDPKRTLLADIFKDWVFVSVTVALINVGFCSVARSQLEGNASRNELRAAKSILAGVCDAVAELDGDLRLAQPSQRLASVLMLHPSRMLTGADLASFIPAETDREKLTREVNSSTTCDGFCKAFHVSMRDSRGIAVPMEVFCVRVHSCDDKEEYLLGFREFADTASQVSVQDLRRGVLGASLTSDAQRSLPPSETESSGTYESAETSQGSASPEVAIWVDVMSPELTMLCCSGAFEVLAGCSWAQVCGLQRNLLRCTHPDQRDDLRFWVDHCVATFDENAAGVGVLPLSVEQACFRFSEHHHHFRLAIRNRVRLVLTPRDGEHWPVGSSRQPSRVAKFVLDRPRWIQGGRSWGRPGAVLPPNAAATPQGNPEPAGAPALQPGSGSAGGAHGGGVDEGGGRPDCARLSL